MNVSAEAFTTSAETLVGAPFRLHGRSPEGGLDCVGLVAHALQSAGGSTLPMPSYNLRNATYEYVPYLAEMCGFSPAGTPTVRGDLFAVQPGPGQLHLLIASSTHSFIHAHAGLRRVVEMNGPIGWPVLYHLRLSEKS